MHEKFALHLSQIAESLNDDNAQVMESIVPQKLPTF